MINFESVTMSYKKSDAIVLKDLSFEIKKGEFVFLIGESGSGKSTIIKLLTREEMFQEGDIFVSGHSLKSLKRSEVPYLRRSIGMVFQDFRLINTKTVYENVAYAMEIVGASKRQIARQVPLVLSTVGLRHKADARPNELSGGEQQRVCIARALVNNPMMILADEPTGNLDPATSENIMVLLKQINKTGTTVLVCTHDKDMVDRMNQRVIEISEGSVVRDEEYSHYLPEELHGAVCPLDAKEYLDTDEDESEASLSEPSNDVAFKDTNLDSDTMRLDEHFHENFNDIEVLIDDNYSPENEMHDEWSPSAPSVRKSHFDTENKQYQ